MRGERQRKRQTKRDGVRQIFKKTKEKDRMNEGESKRKRKKRYWTKN